MAKQKEKKESGKGTKGIGILVVIAAILGLGTFGFGMGFGTGTGNGDGTANESQNNDNPARWDVSATPHVTIAPTEIPETEEGNGKVELTEVIVEVNKNMIKYGGSEMESAQGLAERLVSEYAGDVGTVLVKINLVEAVYDTVEELKLALEGKSIKYEIVE